MWFWFAVWATASFVGTVSQQHKSINCSCRSINVKSLLSENSFGGYWGVSQDSPRLVLSEYHRLICSMFIFSSSDVKANTFFSRRSLSSVKVALWNFLLNVPTASYWWVKLIYVLLCMCTIETKQRPNCTQKFLIMIQTKSPQGTF